ncbi:MAG TPA: hypothetical protein VNO52_00530 [Methylomirabilota bacterium]|nr:hypothetical protein [Methylomirabilota bacterium]
MLARSLLSPVCLLAALGLLAGCATDAPDVTAYYDPITGTRTDLMENELPSPARPRELIWLNASRVPKGYNEWRFYLEVRYMATEDVGWLDIPPGETLTLTLDGKPVRFGGSGSLNMRKEAKKGIVRESAIYEVTEAQLRQIAAAKSVVVQIRGKAGLIERSFAAANFERLQRFLASAKGS